MTDILGSEQIVNQIHSNTLTCADQKFLNVIFYCQSKISKLGILMSFNSRIYELCFIRLYYWYCKAIYLDGKGIVWDVLTYFRKSSSYSDSVLYIQCKIILIHTFQFSSF